MKIRLLESDDMSYTDEDILNALEADPKITALNRYQFQDFFENTVDFFSDVSGLYTKDQYKKILRFARVVN